MSAEPSKERVLRSATKSKSKLELSLDFPAKKRKAADTPSTDYIKGNKKRVLRSATKSKSKLEICLDFPAKKRKAADTPSTDYIKGNGISPPPLPRRSLRLKILSDKNKALMTIPPRKKKSNEWKLSFQKKAIVKVVDIMKAAVSINHERHTVAKTEAVKAVTQNEKLWNASVTPSKKKNKAKKECVEKVVESFDCEVCQKVAKRPVNTPCLKNLCMGCVKKAFQSPKNHSCPCCHQRLVSYKVAYKKRPVLTGYDIGKK